ncbi:MAG: helix-turn-helix transcriptional regulator [Eggerthellaceae bacterium]|jgi:putative molybdopterin biosynthesis protein|nr:helix-turn-helix transcriptional regulator [Eggerthellaceae bacterium]
MANDDALTADEVAEILRIGKNAVYALAKSGELSSYRIGRRLRFTYADIQEYIVRSRETEVPQRLPVTAHQRDSLVLCGQDIILDVLSNYVTQAGVECLRSYVGSYDALTALYKDEVEVASAHLWDGDTDTYNTPFVKRLLPGIPTVVIHLTDRTQGFYVEKGNPKGIGSWEDLLKPGLVMVNREKGAGSRVLLDEHMRLMGATPTNIAGYDTEVQSHVAVASAVARHHADVAVGSEKIARQVDGIDFIPMQKERYDLVVKKARFETKPIQVMMGILESGIMRDEFAGLGGYDTSDMGRIVSID